MLKLATIALLSSASIAMADAPVIQGGSSIYANGLWKFTVTISHDDQGWEDYVEAWRILDQDGNVLALRRLIHPHEGMPSFTRSVSNVDIPKSVKKVHVQAYDTLGGWRPKTVEIPLP